MDRGGPTSGSPTPCRAAARPLRESAKVGDRDEPESRQPVRPARAGVRQAERGRGAHAGAAASGRGGGDLDGAGVERGRVRQAGVRVPRAHGGALGRGRGARWDEMDTEAHAWTVPAGRIKANRAHRVPLCRRALNILDTARTLSDHPGPLVLPAGDGERLDEKVLRRLLERQRARPFLIASAPPSGTGRPSRRSTGGRSSRRRCPRGPQTRSRRRTRGRTCWGVGG